MSTPYYLLFILSMASFLLSASNLVAAACTKSPSTMILGEATSEPLNFGLIHYSSDSIQPVGSILGQLIIPPTHRGLKPDTVLWTCDQADLPNIYFLVATSGWNSFGGHDDLGNGIYATWFRYIGLKQKMAGITLSRYWQKINIKTYKLENNKIKIRLKDTPALEATLYKMDQLPTSRKATLHCNAKMAIAGTYSQGELFDGGTDYCKTASAFIQLSGNSKVSLPFAHDQVGEDSNAHSKFFYANNGLIYGLGNSDTTLIQDYSCLVKTQNPLIQIPSISAIELKNNATISAPFKLELECNGNLQSGTSKGQIAIGFLPSANTQQLAKQMNLLNNQGTSRFLIPENYHHATTAKGIGITIQNAKSQHTLQFLSPNAPVGGGNAAGWYAIEENNTTLLTASNMAINRYSKEFIAILQRLPNQTPTAGQFKATAVIKVKIQ